METPLTTSSTRPSSTLETPVPLPCYPSEALANRPDNSSTKQTPGEGTGIASNPLLKKQRLSEAPATRPPLITETPVPLPLSVRQAEACAASAPKRLPECLDRRRSLSPDPSKKHISLATDKTPYSVWVDARGNHVPTRGALIPAFYRLHDDPEYPFICPIRHCRRILPSLFALGGHFGASHKDTQVNDNLDGTFTQVGMYKNSKGTSPCMVVSQTPPPPGAAPPVEPRLPYAAAYKRSAQLKRQRTCDEDETKAKRQMAFASNRQVEVAGDGTSAPRIMPEEIQRLPALSQDAALEQNLIGRRSTRKSVLARLQADKDVFRSPSLTRSSSVEQKVAQYGLANQSEQADYEMEDWEIAPGRVTSQDSLQNVAFSGAFLASSTPIAVCSDIFFNVLTIRPGQIHHITVPRDKMQMYSLASGKIQVKTNGQTVQLGPNGAFPLRPGEQCVVENKLYTEATLHCTTVNGYEMSSED